MESDRIISARLRALKQAHQQRITRVVCSGGGAKGVVYPGAYKGMEETGLLEKINVFAGTSAGAITATLMAVGMPSATLRDTLLATNLKALLGNKVGATFGKNPPGVCFITKDGKPIVEFIRHHIIKTVKTALSCLKNKETIASQHHDFKKLLIKLQEPKPRFTFGDLTILNRLFPTKFKLLVIPAVKFPHGEIQIFNEDTPDVEIALACRASASLPVILKPVEIEVDGKKQKFVDGGLYDNLPTDYFDKDSNGLFTKNKHPEQTLVFAFGQGMNDRKNHVFQALYGQRWDETISETVIEEIISTSIQFAKEIEDIDHDLADLYLPKEKYPVFGHAIQRGLDELVTHDLITPGMSHAIMTAVDELIDGMLLRPAENSAFLKSYQQENTEEGRVKILGPFIKEQLRPDLCEPSALSVWKRTVLIETLADLQMPYKNPARDEINYHKLRSEYPLRTVELRVGNITTLDFNDATKYARIMDVFGYLDTINYICNHQLHNPIKFNPDEFCSEIVSYFEYIYQATLCGATKEIDSDPLWQEMTALRQHLENCSKNAGTISWQIYHLVRTKAEKKLDSVAAFALSRAVEFRNQILKADKLFEETYQEGFKLTSPVAVSTITGERFFRLEPLKACLKDKNLYHLYAKKSPQPDKTRTGRIFEILKNIKIFREEYERCLESDGIVSVRLCETAL